MADLVLALQEAFQWRARPKLMTESKQLSSHEIDELSTLAHFDWPELTGETWEKCFDAIFLFSPEAFCYYLPGLIKVSFEEREPNLISVSSIVGMLDRSPTPEWWDDFFLARWPLLTVAECKVVQEWLLWLSSLDNSSYSDDSLERALDTVSLLIKLREKKAESIGSGTIET